MKNNLNASAVAVVIAPQTTPANAKDTPARLRTTPSTSTKGLMVTSSVDIMALAYCIAEEKDMDIKVVHDLLVTAAEIMKKGDVGEIWERVKQLTRGGDEGDKRVAAGQKRSVDQKHSTGNPELSPTSPENDPAAYTMSTSAVIIADSDETEEEAYEDGYQNGLEDGERGFGRVHAKRRGGSQGRRDLNRAYKEGYELGYATGKDAVSHGTRDKRTDAEAYYNGFDMYDDDPYID